MPNTQSQPRQNPAAKPATSLQGTMMTPPPVDVGGIQVPADYGALLNQQAAQPVPYEQAPGGADTLMAVLGGLLSGNPGAIFTNIMETRAKGREVEQANMKAMQENARARTNLLMDAMTQRREDALKPIEGKIKELQIAGREADVEQARKELALREKGLDLDYRRNQLEEANLRLERTRADLQQKGNKEAAEDIAFFHDAITRYARQLETQLRQGADEPVLRVVDSATGDVEELRGFDAIDSEFQRQLTVLTNQLAVEDALPLQDAVEEAYNQILQPLMDEWGARTTQRKVEAAERGKIRAKAGIEKYTKEAKRPIRKELRGGRLAPMPATIQPFR